ncbi:MAG: 50S ribosomal protein L10 [Candidatus Wolfebacteria bacterium]|nr:50S ribosomal protein L10 [Candidatus Wolfebacteria bacterium]
MLTKSQKTNIISDVKNLLKGSKILLFTDFTGISVEESKFLRRLVNDLGAKYKVIKKKLMRVAFENSQISFNPERFESQLGTIFSPKDISEVAGPVYKFFSEIEKKRFSARGGSAFGGKILGAYDLEKGEFLEGDFVKKIGQLPSREIILGQLAGVLSAPLKMFMYVLDQKMKQMVEK